MQVYTISPSDACDVSSQLPQTKKMTTWTERPILRHSQVCQLGRLRAGSSLKALAPPFPTGEYVQHCARRSWAFSLASSAGMIASNKSEHLSLKAFPRHAALWHLHIVLSPCVSGQPTPGTKSSASKAVALVFRDATISNPPSSSSQQPLSLLDTACLQ